MITRIKMSTVELGAISTSLASLFRICCRHERAALCVSVSERTRGFGSEENTLTVILIRLILNCRGPWTASAQVCRVWHGAVWTSTLWLACMYVTHDNVTPSSEINDGNHTGLRSKDQEPPFLGTSPAGEVTSQSQEKFGLPISFCFLFFFLLFLHFPSSLPLLICLH